MATLEAIKADAEDAPIEIPLRGETVHIKPYMLWPVSGYRALTSGDFDTWAEKCLVEGDFATWTRIDPTFRDIDEFFDSMEEAMGLNPKGSPSLPRTRRTTPRR